MPSVFLVVSQGFKHSVAVFVLMFNVTLNHLSFQTKNPTCSASNAVSLQALGVVASAEESVASAWEKGVAFEVVS